MNANEIAMEIVTHELKCWPEYFDDIESGKKNFEVRKLDRLFGVGDILYLREWSPLKGYSGRETKKVITYVMIGGQWGLAEGNCILAIAELSGVGGMKWVKVSELPEKLPDIIVTNIEGKVFAYNIKHSIKGFNEVIRHRPDVLCFGFSIDPESHIGGLFQHGDFTLHSGQGSNFKIDCDKLSDKDLEALAFHIWQHRTFGEVYGIPKGGERLADQLGRYIIEDSSILLIVDDVMTTGNSMNEAYEKFKTKYDHIEGAVIFNRGANLPWVYSVFNTNINQ